MTREERYEVAAPTNRRDGLASDGASSSEYVSVARDGSPSGEEDIEYCLGRMGGRRERKVPNGSEMEGKRSRRSRMEARLMLISLVYESPVSFCSSAFVASSLVASASFRIPYCQTLSVNFQQPIYFFSIKKNYKKIKKHTLFVAGCDSST